MYSTNSQKYYLTGGNGFIGRHFQNYFSNNKIEYSSYDLPEFDLANISVVQKMNFQEKPGVIIHAATSKLNSFSYSQDTFKNNVTMITGLLSRLEKNLTLINLGSGSEFNRSNWNDDLREEQFGATLPTTDHELSKYVVAKLIETSQLACNLRLFGIFGEHDSPVNKFISNCIAKCIIGLDIEIYKDRKMSFVYVQDLPRFLCAHSQELIQIGTLNFPGCSPISLTEIAMICREVVGNSKIRIKVLNPGRAKSYVASQEKFNNYFKDFEWTPVELGIKKLMPWISEALDDKTIQLVCRDQYLQEAKRKDV